MTSATRHQCLIYDGPPSRQLAAIAAVVRDKLRQNHRCLYLNSSPMVAGMRSYLAAAGVDVTHEMAKGSLVLSPERQHLVDGHFDPAGMMQTLEAAVRQALQEGYVGLWATGDMTWEMGSEKAFAQLLDYEWRLEECMRANPALGGICQYHASMVPREALRHGLLVHPSIFLNETLSLMNPHYVPPEMFSQESTRNPDVEIVLQRLCQQ